MECILKYDNYVNCYQDKNAVLTRAQHLPFCEDHIRRLFGLSYKLFKIHAPGGRTEVFGPYLSGAAEQEISTNTVVIPDRDTCLEQMGLVRCSEVKSQVKSDVSSLMGLRNTGKEKYQINSNFFKYVRELSLYADTNEKKLAQLYQTAVLANFLADDFTDITLLQTRNFDGNLVNAAMQRAKQAIDKYNCY